MRYFGTGVVAIAIATLYAFTAAAQSDEDLTDPSAGEAASADPAEPAADPTLETLSLAELEALGLEQEGPRVDTDVHFWGFVDFNSLSLIRAKGGAAFSQGKYQSFLIGNANLYLSKNLSESFRTMGEVRFTYLPNGSYTSDSKGYLVTDTSTVDYANGQAVTRWGGIILQRIYLEWTLHRFITVRGGQFMTPIGIWNVDHGSPTYIPVQRPFAITSGFFPEWQVGLEAFGRWSPSNEHTFGYHLTLSNGTGPIREYKDLDRNKAVGGRLFWEYYGDTYVRGGVSGYYGRDTNATPSASITASSVDLTTKINTQSDILTLAADLLFKRGGVMLQAEMVTQQRRYTSAGRIDHSVFLAPVSRAASADTFSFNGYGLAAYRFEWYGFTPYVLMQGGKQSPIYQGFPDGRFTMYMFSAGLSVRPIDSIVFKGEFFSLHFEKAVSILQDTINAVQFQAAWAF